MLLRKIFIASGMVTCLGMLLSGCEKGMGGSGGPLTYQNGHGDGYIAGNVDKIVENPFIKTADSATSTFSIDADGASYAVTRRAFTENWKMDFDGIRTEEFLNYFTYDYSDPADDNNIAVNGEVSVCPWNDAHKLIRIGIKGKSITKENYPAANFVLLIDVSGSMGSPDKLQLLKDGFIDFTNQMRPQDRIAIVTYAGYEKLALESTPGTQKSKIIDAISKLGSGGGTNGSGGIKLAYDIAKQNFIANGNNRVILGTDGDFNIGITDKEELVKLIEEKREQGRFSYLCWRRHRQPERCHDGKSGQQRKWQL
jgi:Ca-activated chloride channel family protein